MGSIWIADIPHPELTDVKIASITNVEHLSSYNWMESSNPIIAVPGCPPPWSPPQTPRKVAKDSGLIYIAQNAFRHSKSPLESLFRSLYTENPSYNIHQVDLITDRNNIRKLLSGYGHEFEKAFTTTQVSGSTGHHRIISYNLGDSKFIVRYETDAYIEEASKLQPQSVGSENEDFLNMMENLSLSRPKLTLVLPPMIQKKGKQVPINSTLEIKTRVPHKPFNIQDVLPQLWVSQTPNLVRAYHSGGTFGLPEVKDVTREIAEWERNHGNDLWRLVVLIKGIMRVVGENGGNAVVKYDGRSDSLAVLKREGSRMLPDDLYLKLGDETGSTEA
ncbi:hypothetical protein N7447_002415, partial [Penicillium robsamsonii]|uniref:uncharacterized protein n=1 Tax=Penicillium robsamsonii TaxID=1792511 RepID=UPI0025486E48